MLQRVAVCCSVLQSVAACCSVLQCFSTYVLEGFTHVTEDASQLYVLQRGVVCCSMVQRVAACCSVLYPHD